MAKQSQSAFRFAPSPNGKLHLGHAYSALFAQYWAQKANAQFFLRIDDIDQARSKPDFIQAIFDDLHWLGVHWSEPVLHQSERFATYQKAADQLRSLDLLFPCFCSRSQIMTKESRGQDPDGAPLYPGTCKTLTRSQVSSRFSKGEAANWRLDIAAAKAKTGFLTYSNAGPTPLDRPQIRYAKPERWGDVVLVRKDTPTSYHLSTVLDDAAQNITHVTRGRDLEAATDIHILLQFLLGLPSPIYTHHKLIIGANDLKLSKSKHAPALADLREAGWTVEGIRAHLGFGQNVSPKNV